MHQESKQKSFFKKKSNEFGGANLKGNPRGKRPLNSKKALHLVLKSSLCKGKFTLLGKPYVKRVRATLYFYAEKYGIRIYRYQNVGNHLHLVLYGVRDKNYTSFIRAVTGRIAQTLLKDMGYDSQGGDPQRKHRPVIKFWDYRPFSKPITWGRHFSIVKDYVLKNLLDTLGLARTKENLAELKRSLRYKPREGSEKFQDSQLGFVFS